MIIKKRADMIIRRLNCYGKFCFLTNDVNER